MLLQNYSCSFFPLGDAALTIEFGNIISEEINSMVLRCFRLLQKKSLPYVTDIVPAYSSLTVHYNLLLVWNSMPGKSGFETVADDIQNILAAGEEAVLAENRFMKIPVCYSEKYAPDIREIASRQSLSVEEVIHLHTSKKYRVYMIGFMPGFPYMGVVDEKIAVPRRPKPRMGVEPGSVGIAGKQTGIYPFVSPGGWQIIGKTPVKLFDKEAEQSTLLQPGDEVEFYSISEDELENY